MIPPNYGKNLSVCTALSLEGITAVVRIDGAVDGLAFEEYVERILAPTLTPRQIVIKDNLSAHTRAAVRRSIEARGARLLFLPSCSPDFNPAEMPISVLEATLRRVETKARDALEAALDAVSPEEARNTFRHCGYSVR